MGIDAQMFVKYRGPKPSSEQLRLWSWDICSALGADKFFIRPDNDKPALHLTESYNDEGEHDETKAGKEYHQDGDTILASQDEWFIEAALMTRYYGPGYERGCWTTIVATAQWLEQNIGGKVFYGGDSSGVCAEYFGPTQREALIRHALSEHGRDYYHFGMRGELTKTPAPCSLCVKDRGMSRTGFGANYIAVHCRGCGRSFESRNDGKSWTTKQD